MYRIISVKSKSKCNVYKTEAHKPQLLPFFHIATRNFATIECLLVTFLVIQLILSLNSFYMYHPVNWPVGLNGVKHA